MARKRKATPKKSTSKPETASSANVNQDAEPDSIILIEDSSIDQMNDSTTQDDSSAIEEEIKSSPATAKSEAKSENVENHQANEPILIEEGSKPEPTKPILQKKPSNEIVLNPISQEEDSKDSEIDFDKIINNLQTKATNKTNEELKEENTRLKDILQRLLPPQCLLANSKKRGNTSQSDTPQETKRQKRNRGGFSSMFSSKSQVQDITDSKTNTPLGFIVAADNTPRGKQFIKLVHDLIDKNQRKFKDLEDTEFRKYKNEREKLQLVNLVDNVPKRILHVFPNTILDKSSVIEANLKPGMTLDEMIKTADKTFNHMQTDIRYYAEDDMQIDSTTEEQRLAAKLKELQEKQKELAELKRTCFNCGATSHRKDACPAKPDSRKVGDNYNKLRDLQDFIDNIPTITDTVEKERLGQKNIDNSNNSNPEAPKRKPKAEKTYDQSRPLDVSYEPGVMSNELREALGLKPHDLPQHIYNMRQIGYPIGWLKHIRVKQNKPLSIIDDLQAEKENQINQGSKNLDLDEGEVISDEENVLKAAATTAMERNYLDLYKFNFDGLVEYEGYNLEVPSGMQHACRK